MCIVNGVELRSRISQPSCEIEYLALKV
jgi:hypothetical protein